MLKHIVRHLCCVLFSVVALAGGGVAAAQIAADYVVGAQDSLKVSVFGEPDLSGSFKVDSDGTIAYPFLGRVVVRGKSLLEISDMLSKQLESGFVRRAQVSVEVETLRQRYIFVIGEVRSPLKYPMTSQMTLIEALAAAGSTTNNAGGDVLILHAPAAGDAATPGAPAATPEERTERVSLADLQVGRQNLLLREGDTIFVQKAEKFYVTGQVKSPGAYSYERNLTVLQALALAGGITEKGSSRRMKVIRIVGAKQVEKKIEMTDTLEPGDTIVIAQRLL
jgi:polysaccharide biosynthesis/export protein